MISKHTVSLHNYTSDGNSVQGHGERKHIIDRKKEKNLADHDPDIKRDSTENSC